MKAPASVLLALLPLAFAAVPAAALDPARPAAPARAPRQRGGESPDLRHSAIGALIDANGGRVPASGVEVTTALAKLGKPVQLPFPFSSVALDSGLSHPRVVLTLRPTPTKEVIPFTPFGGWGGAGSGSGPASVQIVSTPIPTHEAKAPRLEGRLFLAANMEGSGGTARVRTVEFISWNSRLLRFDFGVIEGMGGEPELRLVGGNRCFSCHKNRGPILGVGPWSNSAHNDVVRAAAAPLFTLAPGTPADPEIRMDGMAVLDPGAADVESAVRAGASLLREREVFRALAKTREGRRAMIMLLRAIVDPASLDRIERRVRFELGGFGLIPLVADSVAIQKATPSDFLADFGPSGSVGRLDGNKVVWSGTADGVTAYDARRAAGRTPLLPHQVPSNPRAFLTPPVNASRNPADHVGAVRLARTLGLTEGDRAFLADTLREAAGWANDPRVSPSSLALDVFTGPEFADVLEGGPLPDRDEFKDRFVAGILATRVAGPIYWGDRREYAGTPLIDRRAREKELADVPPTPTSACLGCHEVAKAGKRPGFSPIPALPFDPFDAAARGAWVRTADRKRRAEVLDRLLRRLGTDKDMPPEDSAEAAFRERDPAAFAAVVAWLEAELRRANAR